MQEDFLSKKNCYTYDDEDVGCVLLGYSERLHSVLCVHVASSCVVLLGCSERLHSVLSTCSSYVALLGCDVVSVSGMVCVCGYVVVRVWTDITTVALLVRLF